MSSSTPKHILEARRARNASAEKSRYATDIDFRVWKRRHARERYRKTALKRPLKQVGKRRDVAHVYGRTREFRHGDLHSPSVTEKCFTTVELARLVDYHPVTLNRLQRRGKFPYPQRWTTHALPYRVYTMDEALALLEVMDAHQRQSQFLYDSDTETINALFRCVPQLHLPHPLKQMSREIKAKKTPPTTNHSTHHGSKTNHKAAALSKTADKKRQPRKGNGAHARKPRVVAKRAQP